MDNASRGAGEPADYQSYLLRLWRENDEEKGWRASLESSRTGEFRGFASLGDLFAFLEKEIGQVARSQAAPNAVEKGGSLHENPRSET